MKRNRDFKLRLTTVLLPFMALLGLTMASVIAFPSQETQRRIDSDDFTKNRRETFPPGSTNKSETVRRRAKRRRTYRLASSTATRTKTSTSAKVTRQLGITIWRLRRSDTKDLGTRALLREKGQTLGWVAERVEADAVFAEGDHVRISVESPRPRYLYVLDRDLFADGTTGPAMLIYPWSGTDNRLFPGRLIDIPGQEEDPSYFTARLTTANQVGELLTFITTSTPLDLPISDKPSHIASGQLRDWEERWGGASERFELDGGAGEAWTQAEQQAASKTRTRQLTRDDPVPQTIYRVTMTDTKAMLVNVRLKYAK